MSCSTPLPLPFPLTSLCYPVASTPFYHPPHPSTPPPTSSPPYASWPLDPSRCSSPYLTSLGTSGECPPRVPDSLEWLMGTEGEVGQSRLTPPPSFSSSSSVSSSPSPSYTQQVEVLQHEADRLCDVRLRELTIQQRQRSGSDSSVHSEVREGEEGKGRRPSKRRGPQEEAKEEKKQRKGKHSGGRSRGVRSHTEWREGEEADEDDTASNCSDCAPNTSTGSGEGSNRCGRDDGSLSERGSGCVAVVGRSTGSVEEKERRSKLPLKSVYHLRAFFTAHVQHVHTQSHHLTPLYLQAAVCTNTSSSSPILPLVAPRVPLQPYPSDEEKRMLADETGLSVKQITVRHQTLSLPTHSSSPPLTSPSMSLSSPLCPCV